MNRLVYPERSRRVQWCEGLSLSVNYRQGSPLDWQLVFIHIRLYIIYLAIFVIVKLHQPIHEAQIYFVFLSVGNPKTVLKGGYSGWKGGSSFASLWFERRPVWACKCAYDCGKAQYHFLFFSVCPNCFKKLNAFSLLRISCIFWFS